eukprot:3040238-Amphidinium_carterae.1
MKRVGDAVGKHCSTQFTLGGLIDVSIFDSVASMPLLESKEATEGCSLVICRVLTSVLRSCRRGLISLRPRFIRSSQGSPNKMRPARVVYRATRQQWVTHPS